MYKYLTIISWIVWSCSAQNSYRLPRDILPEHYELDIITSLEPDFKFGGLVRIDVRCLRPTSQIILHSNNLTIADKDVSVLDGDSKEKIAISSIKYDLAKEFMQINTEQPLIEDKKYILSIEFTGILSNSLTGYYKSSYKNPNNEVKWLAVTQFEPTYARRAFPCFDEPDIKATFEIRLGRPEGYTSLSNMPIESTLPMKDKPKWYWDKFENSVPMSTYLVAYLVSDFEHSTAEPRDSADNVTFNIWVRKNAINQVEFAKEVGPRALRYYEEFYDLPFPLPKQDMIAIPDFSAGAMENWGLITYRETALLYDKNISTAENRHRVASVIAHELAHQWFGNLVTMKWWTDLWLNEGFATYMAALAVHNLYPEWNSLDEEIMEGATTVFSFDSLQTSHPVSVAIEDPNTIPEIFDTIAYEKGSFLIRMMDQYLGAKTLREGVTNYLKKHKYGNAEQDDLWESLTEVAHKNKVLAKDMTVKTIMDSWTLQTGYPVVKVVRNYEKGSAELSQERFFRSITAESKTTQPCWWVPISYTSSKELDVNTTTPKLWMKCPKQSQSIQGIGKDDWLLLNLQIAGLYKVNYDEQNWKFLIKQLKQDPTKIPVLNRVQLIDDAAEFAWVGTFSHDLYFNLLSYLKVENDNLPWTAALSKLNMINLQLRQFPVAEEFRKFMRNLLQPQFDKLGFRISAPTEKLDAVNFQSMIIRMACKYGLPKCVKDSKRLFSKMQTKSEATNQIPKDLRNTVYCTAIREGGEEEWNHMWSKYLSSNQASERISILKALGCSKDPKIIKKYLEKTLDESSGIRKQDATIVFSSVLYNVEGFEPAKEFLMENIDVLYKLNKEEPKQLTRYLKAIANSIVKEGDFNKFKDFIASNQNNLLGTKQGTEQALETANINLQWQARYRDDLTNILQKYD